MVNPISVIKKSNLRNIVVEIYFQAGWMLMIKKVIVCCGTHDNFNIIKSFYFWEIHWNT